MNKLIDQSKHKNTDFSIIKYSLENFDNGNYSCRMTKKGMPDVLLIKVDIIVPKIMLLIANGLENNL